MRADDLDFELPPELIAQEPPAERGDSRLLHYRISDRSITHRNFAELPGLLRSGDLLVFNDTRVIPARFELIKSTGGRVEGLLIEEKTAGHWLALLRNLGNARELIFAAEPGICVRVEAVADDGQCELVLEPAESADTILSRIGRMPLPPYIRREKSHDPRDAGDRSRYQTVYAASGRSVAAPTAGLHFTPDLLTRLDAAGIERASVTLDVGMGTFRPIRSDDLGGHVMHSETYQISDSTADRLNRAKAERRRIIAVGTTSARVLESQPTDRPIEARGGATSIFIYPPYQWRYVDALITNFHLPRSTLIALVAAKIGLEEQRRVYQEAIQRRYRFFSYGDAMLIE